METKQKTQDAKMDDYTACSIAEGFCGYEPTKEETLSAWSHLIKTGLCWNLQGWYGRTANALINRKVIDKEGNILLKD